MQSLRVNGYDMAYLEVGEDNNGPPLVCVHGSLCDFRIWSAVLGPLTRKHRVIAVSLRHFFPDHWDGVGDTYSIAQHVDDLTRVGLHRQRYKRRAVAHPVVHFRFRDPCGQAVAAAHRRDHPAVPVGRAARGPDTRQAIEVHIVVSFGEVSARIVDPPAAATKGRLFLQAIARRRPADKHAGRRALQSAVLYRPRASSAAYARSRR